MKIGRFAGTLMLSACTWLATMAAPAPVQAAPTFPLRADSTPEQPGQ